MHYGQSSVLVIASSIPLMQLQLALVILGPLAVLVKILLLLWLLMSAERRLSILESATLSDLVWIIGCSFWPSTNDQWEIHFFLVPWYILKQNCLCPGGCSNKISKNLFLTAVSQLCRLQSLRSRWGYIDSCILARPLTLPFNMNFKRDTITGSIAKIYPHSQYWAFGIKEKKNTFLLCKLLFGAPQLGFRLCLYLCLSTTWCFNRCLNWMWILYEWWVLFF